MEDDIFVCDYLSLDEEKFIVVEPSRDGMTDFVVGIDTKGACFIIKEPEGMAEWIRDDYAEWRYETEYTEPPGVYLADYWAEGSYSDYTGEHDYDSGFHNFRPINIKEMKTKKKKAAKVKNPNEIQQELSLETVEEFL